MDEKHLSLQCKIILYSKFSESACNVNNNQSIYFIKKNVLKSASVGGNILRKFKTTFVIFYCKLILKSEADTMLSILKRLLKIKTVKSENREIPTTQNLDMNRMQKLLDATNLLVRGVLMRDWRLSHQNKFHTEQESK